MTRYFIDTCVLIWLLDGNKRCRKVAEKIEYCSDDFAVSMEVLKEFANLLAKGDVKMQFTHKQLVDMMGKNSITVCRFETKHLKYLFDLPYFTANTDPADRNIVAHAIADKRTLISGDNKFHLYEKHGLKFLEV